MAALARISAVLVGLANAAVFALAYDKPIGDAASYFPGDLPSWQLAALFALCAILAGLLAAEVVLRFVREGLRDDYYSRHLTMVLAVALGGMLLGPS